MSRSSKTYLTVCDCVPAISADAEKLQDIIHCSPPLRICNCCLDPVKYNMLVNLPNTRVYSYIHCHTIYLAAPVSRILVIRCHKLWPQQTWSNIIINVIINICHKPAIFPFKTHDWSKKNTKTHIEISVELSSYRSDRAAAVEAHWCSWYTAAPMSSTYSENRRSAGRWWLALRVFFSRKEWSKMVKHILKYLELSWIWRMFNIKNKPNKGFRMFPAKSTNKNAIAIARRFQKRTRFCSWMENSN